MKTSKFVLLLDSPHKKWLIQNAFLCDGVTVCPYIPRTAYVAKYTLSFVVINFIVKVYHLTIYLHLHNLNNADKRHINGLFKTVDPSANR